MRVLHINTFNQHGGAETITNALFSSNPENSMLVKKKLHVTQPGITEFPINQLDRLFLVLDKLKWRFQPDYSFKKVFFMEEEFNSTYKKLKKMPCYLSADIIHLHNIHGGFFDIHALEDIAQEKKIVWTLHDMWCMTGGEAYTFENENYVKGIGKTPYLNVPPLNNPVIDRREHYIHLKKELYKKIAPNITFVPVSDWLNKCLLKSYVWNQDMKIRCIKNGIDTTIFNIQKQKDSQMPSILIFNSTNIFKGENIYTEILTSIPCPFELHVVGSKIQINNPNLQNIQHYEPIKDRHQLAELYNEVDILLFPSKADNLPLVPLEAMACGVCVFASDVGGIPEIIKHNTTGFLFSDKQELTRLLAEKLAELPLLRSIGLKASQEVNNHFTLPGMIAAYEILYSDILNTK